MRDRPEPVGAIVGAGQHRENPRCCKRRGRVDHDQLACAYGERTITACAIPGKAISSAKQPPPVSNRKSSLRRTGCPIAVPIAIARVAPPKTTIVAASVVTAGQSAGAGPAPRNPAAKKRYQPCRRQATRHWQARCRAVPKVVGQASTAKTCPNRQQYFDTLNFARFLLRCVSLCSGPGFLHAAGHILHACHRPHPRCERSRNCFCQGPHPPPEAEADELRHLVAADIGDVVQPLNPSWVALVLRRS